MLQLPSRSSRCSCCSSSFASGERITSFILLRQDASSREDLCESCYRAQADAWAARTDVTAVWSSQAPHKERAPPVVPPQCIEVLADETVSAGVRWLLALYLHRRHQIVLVQERTTAGFRVFEIPETGACVQLLSCSPTEEDAAQVEQLLVQAALACAG